VAEKQYSGELIDSLKKEADIASLVDALSYASYAHNRRSFPNIDPFRWARIYKDAEEMEARFQIEQEGIEAQRIMGMQRSVQAYEA
jgi:hypothetical protein